MQGSKNIENENVLAFGSCVRPAVVGDTNSWKKNDCEDFYHESWFNKYDIHSSIGNSTFLLCDSAGVLMGTGTCSVPYLDVGELVNTGGSQAMLSIYKIEDIFSLECGSIIQIMGCKDQYVNGVYHTCWNEGLKAYVVQKKSLGWGGFMQLVDAFSIVVSVVTVMSS